MAKPGRKSGASLSVVAGRIDGRPCAAEDLMPFQRSLWERMVAAEASSCFKTPAFKLFWNNIAAMQKRLLTFLEWL